MNDLPRKVRTSTIINILKKKPIPMLCGFLFTVIPVLLVTILTAVFSSMGNDTIDYDQINTHGKEIAGEITDLETKYNVTINGVHPTIVSYKYRVQGTEIESKYKVLEDRSIIDLKIGQTVRVKELNGNSIIAGVRPSDFSMGFLFLIPIPFLLIGLPFLIYSVIQMRKELKIYKYGEVSRGKIVSMIPKSGIPIFNWGLGTIVHYEYETKNGTRIGESFTTDLSIICNKKREDTIPIFVLNKMDERTCLVPQLESFRNNWAIEFE
ncbi:MAG: hypothetical protein ACEPOZ_12370 [Marinifilaceae bacterium]